MKRADSRAVLNLLRSLKTRGLNFVKFKLQERGCPQCSMVSDRLRSKFFLIEELLTIPKIMETLTHPNCRCYFKPAEIKFLDKEISRIMRYKNDRWQKNAWTVEEIEEYI